MSAVHFFFSSRRRHTRWNCDWSSDVCSSDLLPSRYGAAFDYRPGDPAEQQRAWRAYVRMPGRWADQIGDMVVEVIARELGVPMLLVADTFERPFGPDLEGDPFGPRGQGRLAVLREPNHYEAGIWTAAGTPGIPWDRLTPLPVNSIESARAVFDPALQAVTDRYDAAVGRYQQAAGPLLGDIPADYEARFAALSARRAAESWRDFPAPQRAQQQLDELRRLADGAGQLAGDAERLDRLGQLAGDAEQVAQEAGQLAPPPGQPPPAGTGAGHQPTPGPSTTRGGGKRGREDS